MTEQEYRFVHARITRALAPELNETEAEAAATEDWHDDMGDAKAMTLELYLEGLISIADQWTDTVDELEYVVFMNQLLRRITCRKRADLWANRSQRDAAKRRTFRELHEIVTSAEGEPGGGGGDRDEPAAQQPDQPHDATSHQRSGGSARRRDQPPAKRPDQLRRRAQQQQQPTRGGELALAPRQQPTCRATPTTTGCAAARLGSPATTLTGGASSSLARVAIEKEKEEASSASSRRVASAQGRRRRGPSTCTLDTSDTPATRGRRPSARRPR